MGWPGPSFATAVTTDRLEGRYNAFESPAILSPTAAGPARAHRGTGSGCPVSAVTARPPARPGRIGRASLGWTAC